MWPAQLQFPGSKKMERKKCCWYFFVFLLTPITVFIAIHLKVIGVSIMHISFLFCNLNLCPIKVNLKSINWKCTAGEPQDKKMKPKHLDRTLVAGGSIHGKRQFNKTSEKTRISCQSLLRFYPFFTAIKNYFYCGTWYWELVVCLCFLHLLKNNPTHFCSHLTQQQQRQCVSWISSSQRCAEQKPQWKFKRDPAFNRWVPSRSRPPSPSLMAVAAETLHFSKYSHIRWLNTTNMQ